MQRRGMEIIGGGDVVSRLPGPLVTLTMSHARPHAGTRHPAHEGAAVMIPAFAALGEGHPAEFRVPKDQGVFKQATRLQVAEESGDGQVRRCAHGREFLGHVGMVVPIAGRTARPAPNLHEADPTFHQPSGHQAATAEILGLLTVQSVETASRLGLSVEGEYLRGAELHPGGQFVGLNAPFQTGIVIVGFRMLPIPFLDQGQPFLSGIRCDESGGTRRVQIGHRRRVASLDEGSLMADRQESRREITALVVRKTLGVGQNDKGRQVVGLAAQGVTDPRPEGRKTRQQRSGVHQVTARTMDVGLGLHGHEERHVVHALGEVGEQVRNPAAALSVLTQGYGRLEHLARLARRRLDPQTRARIKGLTGPTKQLRLVVEEVHLAGTAIHEQLDHPLGPGLKVGTMTGRHRIDPHRLRRDQLPERHPSETGPEMPHELPPAEPATKRQSRGVHGTKRNSLLLKINRQALARPCFRAYRVHSCCSVSVRGRPQAHHPTSFQDSLPSPPRA